MAPRLSISYDAGGANGPVGYGWNLSGTSVITRCHGTIATDGLARRGAANAPTDKLCLDGQRLIQTDENGNPNAAQNAVGVPVSSQTNDAQGLVAGQYREFRTEKDSFARIRAYGSANGSTSNGPAYFKVWTKDGRIHEYGTASNTSASATVTPVASSVVVAWAVSRISDRRGNYIDFQYDQRQVAWGTTAAAGREWTLMEVRYTGTATEAPNNKVTFVYEDRPVSTATQAQDRSEAFVLGFKHVGVRRVYKIQTFVNVRGTPVKARTFKLSYSNGPRTNRSRLDAIAECVGAADDICLPATRFEYEPGADERYEANAAFKNSPMATLAMHSTPHVYGAHPIVQKLGVLTGDFNADGKTDILRWGDDPAQNQLWFSNGDGSFTPATAFNITEGLMQSAREPCYRSLVADFDGDGLMDIFRFRKPTGLDINGGAISCAGATTLFLNNGNGSFTAKPVNGVALYEQLSLPTRAKTYDSPNWEYDLFGWTRGETFYVLDVNGDGKLDIVTAVLPYQEAVKVEPDNPCATVVCTRVFLGDGQGNFSETQTNVANKTLYSSPGPNNTGQPSRVVDVDGDGIADISDAGNFGLDPGHDGRHVFRSRGDGNFDDMPYGDGSWNPRCDTPIDINGDGRNDCLTTKISSTTVFNTPLFAVSDGTGHTTKITSNFASPLAEIATVDDYQQGEKRVSSDVVVADIDGDGRQDLIRWHDDPSKNTVFLANGDGTFRESTSFNLKAPQHLLQDARSTAAIVLGNFTGRGNVEILRLRASPGAGDATSNQLFVKASSGPPPDRLVAVVSSTGARTSFTWVPLSNSASGSLGPRYTSDRTTQNPATYPNFDIVTSAYVVASSTADSGVGSQTVVTDYAYYGLKVNHEGRGSLGFREVRRQKPGADGNPLTQVSRFAQTYPYTGMNSSVEMWLDRLDQANPRVIGRTQIVLCDKSAAAGAEASASMSAPCTSSAKIRRPYVYKTTEQTWDSGAPLPAAAVTTIVTTNTVNDTGDPTRVVVSTTGKVGTADQTYTKTTDHLYKADATSGEDWFLGRVEKTTLTNTVPNLLDGLPASAGTSRYASSTTIVGSVVAVSSNTASAMTATKGGVAGSGTVTFTNTGDTSVTLSLAGIGAPYTLSSSSCTLNAGSTCSVTVTMATTGALGSQGGQTLTATGGDNGPVTANIGGTLVGSAIAVSSNGASALSANKGAAAATGTVTYSNSGNQAATLTFSGLSSPYAVSPSSCNVAAGSTCSVTVSMATSGSIGAQGAQTLVASGGTNGNVTATVSGTLYGSSIATTANNATSLSATYGAAPATGTVTFTNSGNQAATLTMGGLSAPYSVSPSSCTAAAGGGTCTVTVSMATSGSVGAQGAQTLVASGGTIGNATATISGTVYGSTVSVTSNGAGALSATYGAAPATGTVTFANSGNQAATVTFSGLSAPYSVSPTSCSLAAGASCSVTVSMATGGSIGAQGAQTLLAAGGSTGNATAAVSGTLNGSRIVVSSNGASALSAPKGGTTAFGVVVFSNTGNQSATVTLGGLSAPYSASPASCTIAAGSTCSVTVSMTTGGGIGSQGAQTLTASGGTTGDAATTVSGTLNGSAATIAAGDLAFGSATLDAGAPSRTLTLRNDGNAVMTLSGLSGLGAPFSLSGNTCSNVAPGSSCAITVTLATSANGSWSQSVNTSGATVNVSLTASGSVNGSIATFTSTDVGVALDFGTVAAGATAPFGTWVFRNDGNVPLTLSASAINSPFSQVFNTCSSVQPGSICSIRAQMGTSVVGSFSQSGIGVSGAARGNRSDLSLRGTVIQSNTSMSGSPTSLSFGTLGKCRTLTRTLTLTNTGSVAATNIGYSFTAVPDSRGDYYVGAGGTCPGSGGSLAAGASCTLNVGFSAGDTGGTHNGNLNVTGNFPTLSTPMTAATSSSGVCQ